MMRVEHMPLQRGLTYERLRQLVVYDQDTGDFTRLARSGVRGGSKGGYILGKDSDDPRVCLRIDGRIYKAYILAWFYVTGDWPTQQIDHRDNNPLNNRFDNLRLATSSQNQANRKLQKNNKTGRKGVFVSGGKFAAQITVRGIKHHLGCFDDRDEAHAAYLKAATYHFGEFARAS